MTDEQGMADAEERRRRKEQAELQRPPRASKHMYRQLPTAVKLTEELTDSLRQLQPEGSVVKDLFNSLQKRGVIETRIPTAQRRRYKLKEYEKHSYKKFQ